MQHRMLQCDSSLPIFRVDHGRINHAAGERRDRKNGTMINGLINHAKNRFAKRIRYNRLVDEIQALTPRDLADMGADRGEMLRHAYLDVYGR